MIFYFSPVMSGLRFRTGLVKNYLIRVRVEESCITKLKSGIVESICKRIIKTTDRGIQLGSDVEKNGSLTRESENIEGSINTHPSGTMA